MATFKRIDIQPTTRNESLCSFASYANYEMDCFFLRKQKSISTSDSSKNIFIVNFLNKDLSYVTIFDNTYSSPNFYKFNILPDENNINLDTSIITSKLDIFSINNSNSLNGTRYRIKSSGYSIDEISPSSSITKFYNILYTNIKWNTETYTDNNFFLKRNGIKELDRISNKEIYFRPLIKLENNETITMHVSSNRIESDEIVEFITDLSWNATDWNENKYLNFIDKGIGKSSLSIDISFNGGGSVDNELYDNIPIEFTNYDISVNIPGIDINYDGKKKELINLNYTDLSFNIVGFNTTGNDVNGINIVAYTGSTDISFNSETISIKNQTDNLLDPSGEYIDVNNGSDYGNNQIYMNVNTDNIIYGTKTLRFSITSPNQYFNNIYIPNITLLVSKITKSQNYYLINTDFGTGSGNSDPTDIILSLVQGSDIDNGQSGSKIIGISMEEIESSGDISFNDLSLNLFDGSLSNAESIETQIISHIQNRENEDVEHNKMLGVKKIKFTINDDTTNHKYKNTIVDSSDLELNVVCLNSGLNSGFDFYVMVEKSNSSVQILIDKDYFNRFLIYNPLTENDITKGRLYFTIERENVTKKSSITFDASGSDISIISSMSVDDTNVGGSGNTIWSFGGEYLSIIDGKGNLQFNEALNVYDTYTYTVTPKYEWKPTGSDRTFTVSSNSKSLTLFMCYNNQYKYGIYNTSSTNKDMYIPLGDGGCGGLSGNIYEHTTNYLTKKQVFSRLAKRNRLKK